ncbi:MAG TPA: hypothetical protein VEY07_06000 [Thermoplasmata archaeon]|nr:hypothetical protein [Thermoplasmata archaeon]
MTTRPSSWWEQLVDPWRAWGLRLVRFFSRSGGRYCPNCGFTPEDAYGELGPPVCPRCGTPFAR